MPLQVELVSPERILYSGEADMVVCRTLDGGDIAFLTGHAPFLGALEIAPVRVKVAGGGWESAAVHGGFVEVRDNRVIILSDVAELAADIDVDRARRAKEAAERAASGSPAKSADAAGTAEADTADTADTAQAALRRAETRLSVAEASR